jgi:cytochrome bd-type quinol oxidase subunit 2
MSSRKRATKKFWKSFLVLFAIYSVIVPAVFLLLDSSSVIRHFNKDPLVLIVKMVGLASGIALIISMWQSRDPELRGW